MAVSIDPSRGLDAREGWFGVKGGYAYKHYLCMRDDS